LNKLTTLAVIGKQTIHVLSSSKKNHKLSRTAHAISYPRVVNIKPHLHPTCPHQKPHPHPLTPPIPSSPPLISQLSPAAYSTYFLTGFEEFEDATFTILKTKGAHVIPAPRDRDYVGYAEELAKDAYRQGYKLALAKAITEGGGNGGDVGVDVEKVMGREW
jgi:hypothetical protein